MDENVGSAAGGRSNWPSPGNAACRKWRIMQFLTRNLPMTSMTEFFDFVIPLVEGAAGRQKFPAAPILFKKAKRQKTTKTKKERERKKKRNISFFKKSTSPRSRTESQLSCPLRWPPCLRREC